MDAKDFVLAVERDAVLISAMRQALHAMELTNGCSIRMDGIRGILHYDPQIATLKLALTILGGEASSVSPPSRRKN